MKVLKTCLAAALCIIAHTPMAAAQECSGNTPCTIPDGDYYIALPDAPGTGVEFSVGKLPLFYELGRGGNQD